MFVLLMALLTLTSAFQADRESTMIAITQMTLSVPAWVSPDASMFISAALDKSSTSRAPIMRLIQHPWILAHTRGSCAG